MTKCWGFAGRGAKERGANDYSPLQILLAAVLFMSGGTVTGRILRPFGHGAMALWGSPGDGFAGGRWGGFPLFPAPPPRGGRGGACGDSPGGSSARPFGHGAPCPYGFAGRGGLHARRYCVDFYCFSPCLRVGRGLLRGAKKKPPPGLKFRPKTPVIPWRLCHIYFGGEIFFAKVIDFIVLSSILDGMSYFGARCRLHG
jgi:hypothetical protein